MGRVLEARDVHTDQRVALKIPTAKLLDDERARARFVREAQAAAMLSHPNVVEVLDVVTRDDGAPVMVLELLEGVTLAAHLRRLGQLSLPATATLLSPVLEALAHAHHHGLVHRDFKPDNIFLARQGEGVVPKLLDFGITKVLQGSLLAKPSNTSTGEILGTPHYMAPEQVCGDAGLDARVDVWAAGVVIYECLAGARPFEGAGVGQILRAILLHPPTPLVQIVKAIPVEVAIAVSEAMCSTRDQRPRDLVGLLAALRPHVDPTLDATLIPLDSPSAGLSTPHSGAPALRRPVTVVVGLPVQQAQQLDPQRAFRLAGALRGLGREVADQVHGTLLEHLDGGVAMVFGLTRASSSDLPRALRAAELLHEGVAKLDLAQTSAQTTAQTEALQIGVASGQVALPSTGSAAVADIWQDAAPCRVARELAESSAPGATTLAEPLQRALRRLEGPMLGRRRELWRLTGALDECVSEHRGAVVLLRGEAGIGKTTLARRLLDEAGNRGLQTHAAPIFDFGANPELDIARGLLTELVLEHRGALDEDHILVLDELLRLPMSERARAELRGLDPTVRSQLRAAGLRRLLTHASHARPLVLWIDDVHWADPASLELVVQVLDAARSAAVMLILTTRPIEAPTDPAWLAGLRAAQPLIVELGPLAEDDALALARRYAHGDEDLARRCVDRASGNPLFLVSVAQELGPNAGAVPASVHSIVSAKLDRLGPEAVATAQAAAVLGRRFDCAPLEHMVPDARAWVPELVAVELLERDPDAYLFRHDLVRDAVYDSLVPAARTALHRHAATWYRERDPLMFARHLDGARVPEAAAAYLAAAEHERGVPRLQSALALARRGEQLVEDDEELGFELAVLCGELERRTGLVADSIESFRGLVQRAKTPSQRARACLGLGQALNLSDRNTEALAVLERHGAGVDDAGLLAAIHTVRGNILFSCGDAASCLREHSLALEAARRAGDASAEARALNGIGDAHYMSGDYSAVIETLRRCIALARAERLPELEAMSLALGGVAHGFRLDVNQGRRDSTQAVAIASEAMDAKARALASSACSDLDIQALEFDACERNAEIVLGLSRRLGTMRLAQWVLLRLAWAADFRGQRDECLRRLDEAWDLAQEVGKTFLGPSILAARAAVEPERALALLERGEAILELEPRLAHNALYFFRHAMLAAFRLGDPELLRHYAGLMADSDRARPQPWRDVYAERGRIFADLLDHGLDEARRTRLSELQARAREAGMNWFAAEIDAVLDDTVAAGPRPPSKSLI